jgi:uncharacterized coiled-coil protein SlyX
VELDRAKEIIQSLADGVDPYTGERFPTDGPYQRSDTVSALFVALEAACTLYPVNGYHCSALEIRDSNHWEGLAMSQFDDLNEALAALKTEMRTATTATQAVSRLGEAADAMGHHATTVEARLKACEDRIAAVDQSIAGVNQSIEALGQKTVSQWKEAITAVLAGSGSEYVDAVTSQVKEAGEGFSASIAALRAEWSQREQALKRAKKWIWILSSILALLVLGIAGVIASGILSS